MTIFQLNPKSRIWQELSDDAGKFEWFFFGHAISFKNF
jgi:hypothetical protein